MQQTQRRLSGPEVVQVDLHATLLQLLDYGASLLRVVDKGGLGNVQHQAFRGYGRL